MMAGSELQPASRHEPPSGRGVEQAIDARACAGCAMRSRVTAGIDSLGLWCYTHKLPISPAHRLFFSRSCAGPRGLVRFTGI